MQMTVQNQPVTGFDPTNGNFFHFIIRAVELTR